MISMIRTKLHERELARNVQAYRAKDLDIVRARYNDALGELQVLRSDNDMLRSEVRRLVAESNKFAGEVSQLIALIKAEI